MIELKVGILSRQSSCSISNAAPVAEFESNRYSFERDLMKQSFYLGVLLQVFGKEWYVCV